MDKPDITKQIQALKLSELHIDTNLTFFEEQPILEERSLELSLEARGNRSLYTVIRREGRYVLIDGIRRYPIELKLHGPDHEVLVWVLDDDVTDEAVYWYRIDRSKNKKQLKVDMVNEYKFRIQRMPSNQGKKNGKVVDYRHARACKEIGVSTSYMSELLRIDKIKPSILHAVDRGERTLSQAKIDAKKFEEAQNEELAHQENKDVKNNQNVADLHVTNEHVDLHAIPTCCPACNRPFSTIRWQEIPSIFSYKRKDEEKQTDWLESVA